MSIRRPGCGAAASRCDSPRRSTNTIEGADEALAQGAAVVRPEEKPTTVRSAPIMPLEQFRHQQGRGVVEKIGRQVADAQGPLAQGGGWGTVPVDVLLRHGDLPRPHPCAGEMLFRRRGRRQDRER